MKHRIDKMRPYLLPALLLVMLGFYYVVNPMMQNFPLQCIWRVLTGTQCPACGFQRAFHALVHGHPWEALSYNFFFIFSVPLVIMAILAEWYNWHHKFDGLKSFLHNRYTLKMYVVLYFGWWIIRNIFNI